MRVTVIWILSLSFIFEWGFSGAPGAPDIHWLSLYHRDNIMVLWGEADVRVVQENCVVKLISVSGLFPVQGRLL